MTARATRSGTLADHRRLEVEPSNCEVRSAALRALDRVSETIVSSSTALDASLGAAAPRPSSTTSSTSWRQLVELGDDRGPGGRRAPRAAGAPPSRKIWMLLRSAAIGVRSSCEASATRWRCEVTERSSASSVRLKLDARRASSSVRSPPGARGWSSALVTASVRCDEAADRRAARSLEIASPRSPAPAGCRRRSAGRRCSSSRCSTRVDLGQRAERPRRAGRSSGSYRRVQDRPIA